MIQFLRLKDCKMAKIDFTEMLLSYCNKSRKFYRRNLFHRNIKKFNSTYDPYEIRHETSFINRIKIVRNSDTKRINEQTRR